MPLLPAMPTPSVSVIIPSRNRPGFLREAILSVLNQTLAALEIVVVDNGSAPACLEAILCQVELDHRVRLIRLDRNYGAGHARNVGMAAARGEWLLFLDDDDLLFTDFLDGCFEVVARQPDAKMVLGRSMAFRDGDPTPLHRRLVSGFDLQAFRSNPVAAFWTQGISVGSCLVRREAIGAARFPVDLRFGEDTLFWLELLTALGAPEVAERAFLAIRWHPGQTTFQEGPPAPASGLDCARTTALHVAIRALAGKVPWLDFLLRAKALHGEGKAWHDPDFLRLLLARPVFTVRLMGTLTARHLARKGYWPWFSTPRARGLFPDERLDRRPKLLFVCGVVPVPSGAGVAMRAYHQVLALARTYAIHLVLVLASPRRPPIPASLRCFCQDIEVIPRARPGGWAFRLWCRWRRWRGDSLAPERVHPEFLRSTRAWSAGAAFHRIHLLRLYLAPLAEALRSRFPAVPMSLDLDDLDSSARKSMAAVHRLRGHRLQARNSLREARSYRARENRFLPGLQRLFTASPKDRAALAERFPEASVGFLPNVVALPVSVCRPAAEPGRTLSLLFVGTLSYFPNADALDYFASQLAPALDARGVDWRLRVVGKRPWPFRGRPAKADRRWSWAGWVADLGPEYLAADIAIAPIRCGGGTRIKLIEAFAQQVPVVATSLGLEGLEIEDGVHCLVADSPAAFAGACERLQREPALGRALAARAAALVRDRHSLEVLDRRLREEWPGEQVVGCIHAPDVGFGHQALVELREVAPVPGPPEVAPQVDA